MSGEHHRGGLLRFVTHLRIPNPLNWVPRPRILGRQRKQTLIASAMGELSIATPKLSGPAKVPLKPVSDVFAGALARAASQSTIHPLDTFKVRLQSRMYTKPATPAPSMFKLALPAFSATASSAPASFDSKQVLQGVRSLYKGVVGAASGAGIAIGAYFAFYGAACNLISRHTELPPSAIAFSAGAIAAVGSSVVKVPLAVCIRSVQAGVYPNVFNAASSIIKATGPRGLFTGYLPTVMEDVPDMAIKFAVYESMRQLHASIFGGRHASPQEDFAMGAAAGALAAAATTPLDVIKTNMMVTAASRPSMMGAYNMVVSQGGPAALFRGVGTRAVSNGINSAVFFCFFEALRGAIAARGGSSKDQDDEEARAALKPALAAKPGNKVV